MRLHPSEITDGDKGNGIGQEQALLRASAYLLAFFIAGGAFAAGQMPTVSTPTPSAGQYIGNSYSSMTANGSMAAQGIQKNQKNLLGATNLGPAKALSSDQIVSILEQNPDLLAELKSQLAVRMQQRGVWIDPSDITDQALYNQIAQSARLRASITTVLVARGYVTENGFMPAGQGTSSGFNPLYLQQGSLFPLGNPVSQSLGEGLPGEGAVTSLYGNSISAQRLPSIGTSLGQEQRAAENPQRQERTNESTALPMVLHAPTPLNLQSLHDLYAQFPNETPRLQRFGADVFVNRTTLASTSAISAMSTPLDVPLGPDYVLGVGDRLTIDLWGGLTLSITRMIDRQGRIFLPAAGAIQVAGLELGKAQALIADALKQQYRDAHVAVTVAGLHSVRVYVVGDVQRPGGYDLSSLATPLSALYAAGGPTAAGSLRMLYHYRGTQLVQVTDLYDFLLHGVRGKCVRFESGDTLLVPPAGPQVAIFGAVKRPAIYELKPGETTLAAVVSDAGGFTPAASLSHIRIQRIDGNLQRLTLTIPDPPGQGTQSERNAIAHFQVKDGDRIRVEQILPYSQRAVYLAGHVVRPGRIAYTSGMRLSNVLRSYRDLLPEPAVQGEIVRLVPPDLHAETIDFNVPDVLAGTANVRLQPFDTIRVFGRYQEDAPTVTIKGEVMRPGTYPMSEGMTAAQLVRMAGGFKRDAMKETADLSGYVVRNGIQVMQKISTVQIGAAVTGTDPHSDVLLKPGDILSIHQIADWTDIGASVTILGQVRYPGTYGITDGERLSSVLRRAGGLLPTAYPRGAVLLSQRVKKLEENSRSELIREIEASSAAARVAPRHSGSNSAGALQLIKQQENQVIANLKSHPPTGRMVIHITSDINRWANTPADVELRRGDVLTVPKEPDFVLVTGQVYNATAITFTPGKTAAWYLRRAGGCNPAANEKDVFVIRANGSVVGRRSRTIPFAGGGVLSTRLYPGDVVVVPEKLIGSPLFLKSLLAAGQLAASSVFAAGVAVATL